MAKQLSAFVLLLLTICWPSPHNHDHREAIPPANEGEQGWIIHARGPSHEPNNNYSHASVVTHLYYTANNKLTHTYDFMQRGLVISQDTPVGKRIYEHANENFTSYPLL
ncbi:hypothetical protein WN943_027220 [Citrus x changshan-huyou]